MKNKIHILSGSCFHVEGTKTEINELCLLRDKAFDALEECEQNNYNYGLITVRIASKMGLKIEWKVSTNKAAKVAKNP